MVYLSCILDSDISFNLLLKVLSRIFGEGFIELESMKTYGNKANLDF